MRVLNGGYSKAFDARHGRRGALFESRYRDWTTADEQSPLNGKVKVQVSDTSRPSPAA